MSTTNGGSVRSVLHDEVLDARAPWAHVIEPGCTLQIVDLEGNQAVDTLFYDAADPQRERYSAQDTIREVGVAGPDDPVRLACAENERAFAVTEGGAR